MLHRKHVYESLYVKMLTESELSNQPSKAQKIMKKVYPISVKLIIECLLLTNYCCYFNFNNIHLSLKMVSGFICSIKLATENYSLLFVLMRCGYIQPFQVLILFSSRINWHLYIIHMVTKHILRDLY